jgi:hypothetical protein
MDAEHAVSEVKVGVDRGSDGHGYREANAVGVDTQAGYSSAAPSASRHLEDGDGRPHQQGRVNIFVLGPAVINTHTHKAEEWSYYKKLLLLPKQIHRDFASKKAKR